MLYVHIVIVINSVVRYRIIYITILFGRSHLSIRNFLLSGGWRTTKSFLERIVFVTSAQREIVCRKKGKRIRSLSTR